MAMGISAGFGAEDISALLEPLREKRELPALAAAAYKDGQLVAIGATGLRCAGSPERVTANDQWHLGSCTKSMTASLAAVMVEGGEIGWDTTIDATLPAIQPRLLDAWKPVTLEQLLGHRAGAPHNAPFDLWAKAWERKGSADQQRIEFVKGLLLLAPDPAPGTKFVYSNQGYTIAAAMLTRKAGKPWEDLMRERLFEPLGLKSAGFGAAGTPGKMDQPWGHIGAGAKAKGVSPGPNADNPPAIWPGGGVHMSIGDFARYAAWHADGRELLKPATFAHLHQPLSGQDYGYGWNITKRQWGGTVINHNGTNTSNYAIMWISPEKRFAVVAACNIGGDSASGGCDDACSLLIQRVLSNQK